VPGETCVKYDGLGVNGGPECSMGNCKANRFTWYAICRDSCYLEFFIPAGYTLPAAADSRRYQLYFCIFYLP
jgi:hypothetical protein